MIALLIYRSDETCPFAFHLCDKYRQDIEGLILEKDDTVTTIVDYGYFHAFEFMDEIDAKPGADKLVQIMNQVVKSVKEA